MTQKDQQNMPKLRFPEFEGAWVQQKVGKFINEHREKSNANNQFPVFTSSRRGLQLQSDYFGDNRLTERDNTGFNVIPPEHITYRSRSDNREFFFNENKLEIKGIISVYYPVFQISNGSNRFFVELLNFNRHLVGRYSVGTSQTVLSLNDLRSIKLAIPSANEQRKIAGFLGAVDTKIAQLAEKKRLLEDYKKGCMQQLFSQKIRFKDDTGNDFPDWKEKRLGDVLTIGSGRDYKHLGDGKIPVHGTGGLMTYVDDFLYEGDSVCIGRKGTIDKPVLLTGKFWTVDTLFYTHSFRDALPRFVYAVFQQINWQMHNEASGVPSLSKSTIESLKVSLPHPDEQRKIADFLSALDRKIDLVGQELTHARSFKQGLLQQMFV